jgi:hypothetical protein
MTIDPAVVLFDDGQDQGQPQARALLRSLGSKERLINPAADFCRDPLSRIGDTQAGEVSRSAPAVRAHGDFLHHDVFGLYVKLASVGDRVPSIETKVQENLL